jgi:uncharacterized repeat protein (TIGR03803 family)
MKSNILQSLTCGLLVLSTTALLRADRDADRRNERIPHGHKMHSPLHPVDKTFDSSSPTGNGYTPQQMRHAYGFDQVGTTGAGQIIAIVDAYGSSTIQADLNTFCANFGIPSTNVRVYYPQGQPPVDPDWPGWARESSLDVEWTHAIAPGATIALIVAKSESTTDLFAAVDYAVSLGATQVSMSWGGPEYSTEGTSDFHFNVPGVTFIASSGDSGSYTNALTGAIGVVYPAASPYVVGVGGTTLDLDLSGDITSETAWSYNQSGVFTGSGGGISAYETAPSYQAGSWSGAYRGVPDVAYDANPDTGVPVYLTGFGWAQFGGTSMGAPQWAALCALANSIRSQSISTAPGVLYSLATANFAGYYHDITSGSNGAYSAGTGYDLVTGLGSPVANQLVVALAGGFSSQVAPPVFFPGTGAYSSAQTVTIISATPGASIRYTLDGSTPTETNGTPYSGPVLISANTSLTAIAYESGFTDSPLNSGNYTFLPQVAAPTFSPGSGTYVDSQTVTISTATNGASIRYTTDGSPPTETNGVLYAGPVTISGTTTLNAIAYEAGFIDSPVTDGTFTIAAEVNVLYNFNSANNGGFNPYAGLVLGSDGNFYGTTLYGGDSNNDGTVFKITPAGVFTTLVAFNGANGSDPYAGLILGSDGDFYGTTQYGGSDDRGTVFKMTPVGALTTLVSFDIDDGEFPIGALVQGSDGNFYGTTSLGGSGSYGTVFVMTPAGALSTLYSFSGADGNGPSEALVQGSDGNFYGTTETGGSGNRGTIFEITSTGFLATLVSFDTTNGAFPNGLVQGSDGNFYGTTNEGGSYDDGTVFRMTPSGALTTLVSFNGANGLFPVGGLVQVSDGTFYGTTIGGGGTAFRMSPTGDLTTLAYFYGANGDESFGALVQGSNGSFYGTTQYGGQYGGSPGDGVVFQLITQQAAAPTFSPPAGTYPSAQTVTIASTTPGASIRFTTDGSTPTETNGTIYFGPINIGSTTTLAAIAYEAGYADSPVTSRTYTIKTTPVISWPAPAPITYGTVLSSTQLDATANVPGTFTYTPAAGAILTAGSQTLSVMFTPTDATDYNDASASVSLQVNAEPVTFTVSPVSFTYNGSAQGPTITPSVTGATYSTSGATSATAAGSYSVTATATGNYTGTSGPMAWMIAQATSVVSWTAPAPITYGTALDSIEFNATANVPGTFAYTPAAGTVPNVGTQTLAVAFTPTDTADYNNASASVSLTVNAQPVTFTISPVSFTYNGSAQGPTITPSVAGATYSTSGTVSATAAGSYSVTATATGNYTGTSGSIAWTITNSSREGPYSGSPAAIPGTVQAENYDTGGQSIAYNVTSINGTGDGYRSDGVDLETTTDTGGGLNLGWTSGGQWFKYTVNVATAATYTVSFRVAAPTAVTGAFHLADSSGTDLSGSVNLPATGGWQAWTTVTASVTLPAGQQVLTLNQDKGGWNINYMTLAVSSGGKVSAPTFNPPAGTYTSAHTVTITSTTSGASIAYTTDGSTPTESGGKIVHGTALSNGGSVSISSTCTLKALAFKSGMTDSTVTSGLYTINVATRSLTGSSGNGWHALALTSAQTGTFTATFDATPTVSPENAVVGLSKGVATTYTGLSCIARFNPTGQIDAYNGTAFQAASSISYAKNISYHFRIVMNVAAHTYSIYVTPAGKSELTVGLNYAFRSTAVVSSLDTWNLDVNATPANCSLTANNLNP